MARQLIVGGVPEHFNLPWHLALERGAFKAEGLNVVYQDYPGGTGAMAQALANNELDIALMLTEGAVADAVNQNTQRLVKVYVKSPLTWGIHTGYRNPIKHLAGMRGARYAISRFGSGSHLMAIVDAELRGWTTQHMEFVLVKNLQGARRALAKNEADIFFWERYTTQPLVDAKEFRRIGQRVTPWPAFCVCARKSILKTQGARIKQALQIVEHQAQLLKRRASATQVIAERYGIKPADARAWFSTVRWGGGFRTPNRMLRTTLKALVAIEAVSDAGVGLDRVWGSL